MDETGNASLPPSSAAITGLLLACRGGSRDGVGRLFPLIYDELHRIAHGHLRREQEGHTLNTAALVHEAYIRLVDITRVEWRDRVHFLSMAARAIRRILIDHARQHGALRRGGGVRPVTLEEEETAQALDVTSPTIRSDWVKARGWLRQALMAPDR